MLDKDIIEKNETLQDLQCLFNDIAYGLDQQFSAKCLNQLKQTQNQKGRLLDITKLLRNGLMYICRDSENTLLPFTKETRGNELRTYIRQG